MDRTPASSGIPPLSATAPKFTFLIQTVATKSLLRLWEDKGARSGIPTCPGAVLQSLGSDPEAVLLCLSLVQAASESGCWQTRREEELRGGPGHFAVSPAFLRSSEVSEIFVSSYLGFKPAQVASKKFGAEDVSSWSSVCLVCGSPRHCNQQLFRVTVELQTGLSNSRE